MVMKFSVGDKIKIVRYGLNIKEQHVGETGIVLEHRTYARRYSRETPTHYVVKFEGFKIPHIYMRCDIEEYCELVERYEPVNSVTESVIVHARLKQNPKHKPRRKEDDHG